jgi:hypothetical protein
MHIFAVLLGWLQLWWQVNQKVWFCQNNPALGIKCCMILLQPFTLCCAMSAVELLQAVQSQLQYDQVLGWFAYRPVTSLQPTTQECMISSSMAAALGSLQVEQYNPQTLFAVISCLPRHEGSSCEIQQCMFQLDSSRYALLCLARGTLYFLSTVIRHHMI